MAGGLESGEQLFLALRAHYTILSFSHPLV